MSCDPLPRGVMLQQSPYWALQFHGCHMGAEIYMYHEKDAPDSGPARHASTVTIYRPSHSLIKTNFQFFTFQAIYFFTSYSRLPCISALLWSGCSQPFRPSKQPPRPAAVSPPRRPTSLLRRRWPTFATTKRRRATRGRVPLRRRRGGGNGEDSPSPGFPVLVPDNL